MATRQPVRQPPLARERMKADVAERTWRQMLALFMGGPNADRFPRTAAKLGLTPGQMKALLDLRHDEPVPTRALATSMACDASYATNLVDSLEAAGFVERRVSPSDRRVKLLHLTASGQRARARAVELLSEPPPAFDRLSVDQLEALHALLGEIVDDLPF